MTSLLQDLHFSLRTLRRKPGFTLVAVLTLALGIGANAAIFSVVNGVLLRPLPYPEPDRLGRIFIRTLETRFALSVADFQFLAETQRGFDSLAAYRAERVTLTGEDRPQSLAATWVTARYFETLGVEPLFGQGFQVGEDRKGESNVVIISHAFWEKHFNSSNDVIEQFVRLNGRGYRVVGVMPADFHPPGNPSEIWPLEQLASATRRGPFFHEVLARRQAAVDHDQAQSELGRLSQRIYERWTGSFTDRKATYTLVPLREELIGDLDETLFVLLGAVAFVLLMATANVAHLLLAKASARRREMALRATLGASHRRLIQQLITESTLLASLGGLAGLLMAAWGLDLLLAWSPDGLPRLEEVHLDGRVLAFTAVITFVAGLICGLAPIKSSMTFSLSERLKGDGASPANSDQRTRGIFVAAEFALALPLLVAAGLMIQSFFVLRQVDPGFNPQGALTLHLSLPETAYPDPGGVQVFYDELLSRVWAVPGVQAMGLGSGLPPNDLWGKSTFIVEGQAVVGDQSQPVSGWVSASTGYFDTLEIPLRQGRLFDDQDRRGGQPVAIIDETLSRRYFPGRSPVGNRIRLTECPECSWLTVVGVVGSVKYSGLGSPDEPMVYVPRAQETRRDMYLAVRTPRDPQSLVAPLREIIETLDPGLALADVNTLDQLVGESMAEPRYRMALLGTFAAVALLLAALGIYGVLSYFVNQSRREIGIRMALGAQATSVRGLVLQQGLTHVAIGVVAGVAATLGLTRFMASLLYGVSATDPAIVTGVTLVLVLVAFTACFLPAHRATRIDPIVVLREE